jgi:hypothetical protein
MSSEVILTFHYNYKGKGLGGTSYLLVEHIYMCLPIMEQPIGKGRVRGRRRERVGANLKRYCDENFEG